MNELYRGTDLTTGAPVAVRVLSARWSYYPPSVERAIEEVRRASALGHPGLVPVLWAGRDPTDRPCVVMPWHDGTDLGRLLTGGRSILAHDVAALLSPVAAALDALHAAGIVHRTLTPSRILLSEWPPHVLLGGFGYGPLVAPEGDSDARPTGTVAGQAVLDYIAPETDRGAAADARLDVYALAAIAFRAIAGAPPFEPESNLVRAIVTRQVSRPPSLSERMRAPVAPELEAVMRTGLAVDVEQRYATAGAFAGDLWRVLNGMPAQGRTGAIVEVAPRIVREAISRARHAGHDGRRYESDTGTLRVKFDRETARFVTPSPEGGESGAPRRATPRDDATVPFEIDRKAATCEIEVEVEAPREERRPAQTRPAIRVSASERLASDPPPSVEEPVARATTTHANGAARAHATRWVLLLAVLVVVAAATLFAWRA